jgi:hypothetical protein
MISCSNVRSHLALVLFGAYIRLPDWLDGIDIYSVLAP